MPVVHGLEAKYCEEVNFAYLDIDDRSTQRYQDALGYIYQPHIFLIDGDGNILKQWVGYVDAAEIEPAIQQATSQ